MGLVENAPIACVPEVKVQADAEAEASQRDKEVLAVRDVGSLGRVDARHDEGKGRETAVLDRGDDPVGQADEALLDHEGDRGPQDCGEPGVCCVWEGEGEGRVMRDGQSGQK